MMENSKKIYDYATISGVVLNKGAQTMIVYFQLAESQKEEFAYSIPFEDKGSNEEAREFFKNLPIFTKNGELDLTWLEGIRVYIQIAEIENGWEIAELKYDVQYYSSCLEEEQDSFYGEEDDRWGR